MRYLFAGVLNSVAFYAAPPSMGGVGDDQPGDSRVLTPAGHQDSKDRKTSYTSRGVPTAGDPGGNVRQSV